MRTFKSIYFSYLRAEAHYEFLTQFKELLNKFPEVREIVADLYVAFTGLYERESALLDMMRKSDYTAQIATTDRRINRCLAGISATITAALQHFNPEFVKAARSLYNRLRSFGYIRRKRYEDSMAALTRLLTDFASPEFAGKVALVGLEPWITELAAAKAAFEWLFEQRYKEAAAKPKGRFIDARRDIEAVYRPMLNRLGAALLVAGDTPGLATFVVELNLIVEHYNRLCRHVRKDIGASGRLMVDPIAVQPYTGRPVTVIPRVYYCDEDKPAVELALGADFSVTYRNNTNDGSAQVIIHGRGAYKGRQAVSFNIVNNEQ